MVKEKLEEKIKTLQTEFKTIKEARSNLIKQLENLDIRIHQISGALTSLSEVLSESKQKKQKN